MPFIYCNVARLKSKSKYMFISGHIHALGMQKQGGISLVVIGKLELQVRKVSHCGSKKQ